MHYSSISFQTKKVLPTNPFFPYSNTVVTTVCVRVFQGESIQIRVQNDFRSIYSALLPPPFRPNAQLVATSIRLFIIYTPGTAFKHTLMLHIL